MAFFIVMRLMQYCRAMYTRQPATLEEFEDFARLSLMKDIYGFYASGSIIGPEHTVQENITAYTRFVDKIIQNNIISMYSGTLGLYKDTPQYVRTLSKIPA